MSIKKDTSLTIFSIGLFICINPWFWFFGIFPTLFGLIKLIISKQNIKNKLLSIFIPLLIWLIAFLLFYKLVMLKKSF